eukprot:RCo050826
MQSSLPYLRYMRQDSAQLLFDWDTKVSLGSGAFASVYRVTCKQSRFDPEYVGVEAGQVYAVKVVAKTPKQLRCTAHEVAILRSLDSTYCVKLYDAFQDTDFTYLVEEYVRGGELFDVIKSKGSLSEQEAVEITLQLINALVYLHARAIVHRDLKPDNVLVTENPITGKRNVKLIDFGFAKFVGRRNAPGCPYACTPDVAYSMDQLSPTATTPTTTSEIVLNTPVGAYQYRAPEALLGYRPRITTRKDVEKLDIFAVGVMVYVMLGGAFPFTARHPQTLASQIRKGVDISGPRFDGVSENAREFCQLLLNSDRQCRPSAQDCLELNWLKVPASTVEYPITPQGLGVVDKTVYDEIRKSEGLLDAQHDQAVMAMPIPVEALQAPADAVRLPPKPKSDIALRLPPRRVSPPNNSSVSVIADAVAADLPVSRAAELLCHNDT